MYVSTFHHSNINTLQILNMNIKNSVFPTSPTSSHFFAAQGLVEVNILSPNEAHCQWKTISLSFLEI